FALTGFPFDYGGLYNSSDSTVPEDNVPSRNQDVHRVWKKVNSKDGYDKGLMCNFHSESDDKESLLHFETYRSSPELDISTLRAKEQELMNEFLFTHQGLFAWSAKDLGRTNLVTHLIYTRKAAPVKQRAYRMSPKEKEFLEREVANMLDAGIISPSSSLWSSPVVLVKQREKTQLAYPYFCFFLLLLRPY
ncbi:6895_t:CDS:2, partial [Gigaspora rosea]